MDSFHDNIIVIEFVGISIVGIIITALWVSFTDQNFNDYFYSIHYVITRIWSSNRYNN